MPGVVTICTTCTNQSVGTAITYQGYLENPAGTPLTDTCDFRFGLWNAAAGGNQVGASPQTVTLVEVVNGVFKATFDFGAGAFDGTARWLAIEVKCEGDDDYVPLDDPPDPRVELNPVPYALRAVQGIGPPNSLEVDTATGNVGIGATSPDRRLVITDGNATFAFDGSTTTSGYTTTFGMTDWGLSIGHNSNIRDIRFEVDSSPRMVITESGGNVIGNMNATAVLSSSSGDIVSYCSGTRAAIVTLSSAADPGGAEWSLVSNADNSPYLAPGGSFSIYDVDDGEHRLTITSTGNVGISTPSPTKKLVITDGNATLLFDGSGTTGGYTTSITMDSTGLGIGHNSSIRDIHFSTNSATRMTIDPAGEVGIGVTSPAHPLHMASGARCTTGGVWTNASSREQKDNFVDVDPRDVLNRVTQLRIRAWNYKNESPHTRHIGPVAEEFYDQFRMGGDDKSIGTIDADGVALAAIQGLHQIVQEKDCEIENLKSEVSNLRDVEARLARLEALLYDTFSKEDKP